MDLVDGGIVSRHLSVKTWCQGIGALENKGEAVATILGGPESTVLYAKADTNAMETYEFSTYELRIPSTAVSFNLVFRKSFCICFAFLGSRSHSVLLRVVRLLCPENEALILS